MKPQFLTELYMSPPDYHLTPWPTLALTLTALCSHHPELTEVPGTGQALDFVPLSTEAMSSV